ncbi:hypothetical protein MTO96_031599 [Rhipicephalus appendiculatus]
MGTLAGAVRRRFLLRNRPVPGASLGISRLRLDLHAIPASNESEAAAAAFVTPDGGNKGGLFRSTRVASGPSRRPEQRRPS